MDTAQGSVHRAFFYAWEMNRALRWLWVHGMNFKEFKQAGHWPTLMCAFLYLMCRSWCGWCSGPCRSISPRTWDCRWERSSRWWPYRSCRGRPSASSWVACPIT
ncbi:protein of unknown function [Candidatus Methylocalor cossyra]|uniref:Transposase DDE domain-containing protein n=1 Tax=Candidatus Methylocalor cossyra TaxID=3108543 RepID=A0ABM9NM17_9GAMM